jgi:hypothetical protein
MALLVDDVVFATTPALVEEVACATVRSVL